MGEHLEKLIWLIVGAAITYALQRIIHARNEKRKIVRVRKLAFRGFPDSHKQLFYEGLTNEIWDTAIPDHLRNSCMTYVFFIESVGRGIIKDLKVIVDAKHGSGIATHTFLVDRTAICDRLETKTVEDKRLIATWKYVNPGDTIDLHLLAAGVNDADDIEIGVDGEGVEVRDSMLLNKCINPMMVTGQAPESEESTTPKD